MNQDTVAAALAVPQGLKLIEEIIEDANLYSYNPGGYDATHAQTTFALGTQKTAKELVNHIKEINSKKDEE